MKEGKGGQEWKGERRKGMGKGRRETEGGEEGDRSDFLHPLLKILGANYK